ncbi:hypothetical protein CC80DRAFT_498764 [Byssothecium circinans]|uniref:Cytochrome P450 n=1 Tax=Byssothecium circinans TaxID=147558 RepID=A0A6A5URB4_9PLEO|nr:hypothetical protein CC80DRAFT_498764 [Byssothecium circinans]
MVEKEESGSDERIVGDSKDGVVDITRWYNHTTFDIITDPVYGGAASLLKGSRLPPWLSMCLTRPKRVDFFNIVSAKVSKCIAQGTTRPGSRSKFRKHQNDGPEGEGGGRGMMKAEIDSNANLLMVAGSETMATQFCGFAYLILTNEGVYKKLVERIRGYSKTRVRLPSRRLVNLSI